MSQFFYSRYVLTTLAGEKREGVLLKNGQGYASLFCWPQFGDPTIDQCLEMLKSGKTHPLIERAIFFSALDDAGMEWPAIVNENHFHYNEKKIPADFTIVKRKIDPFTIAWPEVEVQWRLDANNKFVNAEHFLRFFRRLPDHIRKNVILVEDPCPYSMKEWEQLEGIALGWDWQEADPVENQKYYSTYVFKPAREDRYWVEKNFKDKNILVTSYLDHPIGQLSALWETLKLKEVLKEKVLPSGLMTHFSYEESDFSKKLKVIGNQLKAPEGLHWGMAEELAKMSWIKL